MAIELACTRPPYYNLDHERAALLITMGPTPSLAQTWQQINPNTEVPQYSDAFVSFTQCCLKKNPFDRATVDELLQHPFIQIGLSDQDWKASLTARLSQQQRSRSSFF
eukprot:c6946_g1_i1.p2 GENE.c6946_g1_i1~~c6946_g1_i1.p2  ORF type:complete len:108 (-),score=13.52 c6946_g1_i1:26-349(-)